MDVISYLLENMKEVFFFICEHFFLFSTQYSQFTTPPPLFLTFFDLHTHTRNWMLDLYVLQVKMGNLIWLNFWFLKIVQSMEFNLYSLFSFFFFFFFQKLWNFFSLCLFQILMSPQHGRPPLALACRNNNVDIAKLLLQNGAHLIVQVCWFFWITFLKTILSLLFFLFFLSFNLPSIWFWENRDRVFFIKFVVPILLLYQLLSS